MDYIILILSLLIIFIIINRYEYFSIPCINVINTESINNLKSVFTNDKIYYNNINCSNLKTKNLHPKNYRGVIVAWSGTLDKIPIGWKLCDGSEYTDNFGNKIKSPDLRSRFIIGGWDKKVVDSLSTSPKLTQYILKSTGGRETHTLTVDEIAPHEHAQFWIYGACNDYTNPGWYGDSQGGCSLKTNEKVAPPNSTIFPDSIENNKPHNNMPPYIALAYIIKI
jgi:hypothetical protein